MQNLFVILVNYTKELSAIEEILSAHREYLKTGYKSGKLLASGTQNTRTGGIMIGQFINKQEALDFTKQDSFNPNNAVIYDMLEFNPVLHQDILKEFLV